MALHIEPDRSLVLGASTSPPPKCSTCLCERVHGCYSFNYQMRDDGKQKPLHACRLGNRQLVHVLASSSRITRGVDSRPYIVSQQERSYLTKHERTLLRDARVRTMAAVPPDTSLAIEESSDIQKRH